MSSEQNTWYASLCRSARSFINLLPIVFGMLLLTSLALAMFPQQLVEELFGHGALGDALIGTGLGSIAAGHPLASYLLGGELLNKGVNLVAVTALMVAWVTVGIIQLPAEGLLLGLRFAICRNLFNVISAIAIAFLTHWTLILMGLR
ncbi:MAG: hypothetical protein OQK54_01920 [Gammaproteobacteria bacterium]|nr:hypothetical protein [Gammaproteobacteria bacterium]